MKLILLLEFFSLIILMYLVILVIVGIYDLLLLTLTLVWLVCEPSSRLAIFTLYISVSFELVRKFTSMEL